MSVHPRKESWVIAYQWPWLFTDEEAGIPGAKALLIAKKEGGRRRYRAVKNGLSKKL